MDKSKVTSVLAWLLKKEQTEISKAIDSDTLDQLLSEFEQTNKVFTAQELDRLIKNQNDLYIRAIVESPDNDIPTNLYNKVKGTVLEKFERNLKRDYEYEGEYEGFEDLVSNIIKTKSTSGNNKQTDELNSKLMEKDVQINSLKEKLSEVNQMHENAQAETDEYYQNKMLNLEMSKLLENVKFKSNGDAKIQEKLQRGFERELQENISYKFDKERDKFVSYNKKTKEMFTDKTGEPLELSEIIKQQIEMYGVPLASDVKGAPMNFGDDKIGGDITSTIRTLKEKGASEMEVQDYLSRH